MVDKLNKEFLTTQLGILYQQALKSVLDQIDTKGFTVQKDNKVTKEGTNRLAVVVSIANKHGTFTASFNDIFRKYQLLNSKDGDVPYDPLDSPLKMSEEIRAINQTPLPKLDIPVMNDKVEITKNDASVIIEKLCSLMGYQFMFHRSSDDTVRNMIDILADKVLGNNE